MKYIQKNQGNIAFPVEKEIVIPGSAPVIPLSTYGFPYENKTATNYGTYEKNKLNELEVPINTTLIYEINDNKDKEIQKFLNTKRNEISKTEIPMDISLTYKILDNKNKKISKAEAYYAPRLPDKKIAQDTKQKIEKSVVKKENKKFEYVNNSKYEIKVTGETQNDVAKKVEGVVRRIQEEEKQRLRAEIGGNYTQAGGLE